MKAERRAAMRRRILAHLTERGPSSLASIANHVGSDGPHPSCLAAAGDVLTLLIELRGEGVIVEDRDVGLGRAFLWSIAP